MSEDTHGIKRKKILDEALKNQLKGILFEFSVAEKLAASYGILEDFYKSLNHRTFESYKEYASILSHIDMNLFGQLESLSQSTANKIQSTIKVRPERVLLVGQEKNSKLNEADIILLDKEFEFPISLKLCKHGHFINTKSAGVKSFFSKYFVHENTEALILKSKETRFSLCAKALQEKLNERIDFQFFLMGERLYDNKGLGPFDGQFSAWKKHQYPELPGNLDLEDKKNVLNFYSEIIECLYEGILELFSIDKNLFLESLWPLLGIGNDLIYQVFCLYHKSTSAKSKDGLNGLSSEVFIQNKAGQKCSKNAEIIKYKAGLSSFEIRLHQALLQIRVKPMNVFTTSGLKVNCSVKLKT